MLSYSQRDQSWALLLLGDSHLNIGRFGCTTTAIADLSTYFGDNLNPAQVASHIKYIGGLVLWASCKFNNFGFQTREYGRNDINIKAALKDPNRAVLLEVNNGSHWVVATGVDIFGRYKIADPWFGDRSTMSRYNNNITGAAYFVRNSQPSNTPTQPQHPPVIVPVPTQPTHHLVVIANRLNPVLEKAYIEAFDKAMNWFNSIFGYSLRLEGAIIKNDISLKSSKLQVMGGIDYQATEQVAVDTDQIDMILNALNIKINSGGIFFMPELVTPDRPTQSLDRGVLQGFPVFQIFRDTPRDVDFSDPDFYSNMVNNLTNTIVHEQLHSFTSIIQQTHPEIIDEVHKYGFNTSSPKSFTDLLIKYKPYWPLLAA